MKQIKNYMIAIAVIATLAGSAYNTTLSKKHTEMSMLQLANIATLANAENPGTGEKDSDCVKRLDELYSAVDLCNMCCTDPKKNCVVTLRCKSTGEFVKEVICSHRKKCGD